MSVSTSGASTGISARAGRHAAVAAVAVVLAAFALPAPAQPAPGAVPMAMTWHFDHEASRFALTIRTPDTAIVAELPSWEATVLFNREALSQSTTDIHFDMTALSTGDPDWDRTLTGPDWFDVANHPTARAGASWFERIGPMQFATFGTVTLRGVTRPSENRFTVLADEDGRLRVVGTMRFDRTEFGLGPGLWQLFQPFDRWIELEFELVPAGR